MGNQESCQTTKDSGQLGTSQGTENPQCPTSAFDGLLKGHLVSMGRQALCAETFTSVKKRGA